MSERIHTKQVGAPDPEMRNSPIVEETDEEYEVVGQELGIAPVCHFNNVTYGEGEFVCSGDELLVCREGAWIRAGSCDTVNP